MKGPHYITPINTIYKILSKYFGKNFCYQGENLPIYLPKLSVLSLSRSSSPLFFSPCHSPFYALQHYSIVYKS